MLAVALSPLGGSLGLLCFLVTTQSWSGACRLKLEASTVTHLAQLVPFCSQTSSFPSLLLLPPPGFSRESWRSLVSEGSFFQLRPAELPLLGPVRALPESWGSCKGDSPSLSTQSSSVVGLVGERKQRPSAGYFNRKCSCRLICYPRCHCGDCLLALKQQTLASVLSG